MRDRRGRANAATASAAGALALAISLLALAAPLTASAEACPNEARRSEQGAAGLGLPDCRAYELVSPLGLEPQRERTNEGAANGFQASPAGGRMAFYSKAGAPAGSPSYGPFYLARRGEGGWSSEDVIPPQSTAGGTFCWPFVLYSRDLSRLLLEDGLGWGEGYPAYPDSNGAVSCSHDEPALVQGEPRGAMNLFLRDNETRSYQLVNAQPSALPARDAWFQAGSADFSHVVFTDPNPLTPEAPAPPATVPDPNAVSEDLYEWAGGTVRLVTILPGGEAAWGLLANGSESDARGSSATWTNAVSADGERVFFRAGGTVGSRGTTTEPEESYRGGGLYLRENATQPRTEECATAASACTVQIDAAQGGVESGDGHFQWASADGSRAFFTDERKLTAGSRAQAGKPDLYEYDLGRTEGSRLADLTASAAEPADVLGMAGVSEDGSMAYFVATADLSGAQQNSQGEEASAGRPNLYLYEGGATTFVATLDALGEDAQRNSGEGDTCDWDAFAGTGEYDLATGKATANCMTSRVTPDGSFLAFDSLRSLTGYDNLVHSADPEVNGLRSHEIFLYEAGQGPHGTLRCASCNPEGLPPTADPASGDDPHILPPMQLFLNSPIGVTYLTRNLSDTGRVFFETANQLLPADTNGVKDVYEFFNGKLGLVSSGKSADEALFEDAGADGKDVFFLTTQGLLRADTDTALSLYDARAGGGFAEPPGAPICETGEACRSRRQEPPPTSTAATAHFEGPGNELSCPKGFAKKHGRCLKPRKHKRKRRHHGARHNRGGAR